MTVRRSGRCPGGQAEVREDLGDHGGSSMAAMSFKVPPQCGHCSMSISNTRFEQAGPAQAHRRHGRGRLGVVG